MFCSYRVSFYTRISTWPCSMGDWDDHLMHCHTPPCTRPPFHACAHPTEITLGGAKAKGSDFFMDISEAWIIYHEQDVSLAAKIEASYYCRLEAERFQQSLQNSTSFSRKKRGNGHLFSPSLFWMSIFLSFFLVWIEETQSGEEMTSDHAVVPMSWFVLKYGIHTLDLNILAIGGV